MTTIAELELRVDSKPIEHSTQALNDFTTAAGKAKQAGDNFSGTAKGEGLAPETGTKKVNNLTEAIDAQARKLGVLAEQRKRLEASSLKTTAPDEYARLNQQIDANIELVRRQGDAVEKLQRAQDRDAEKAQNKADVQARAQDRILRGVERQENVLTNAAAKQQRQIEQTIKGLDDQIAAQIEYNRTMEVLNRARATGGMDGGTGISAGEYEHLAAKAAAQRDMALAMQDTGRQSDQLRNKLETYTATLSKADRAEVELVRATRTLNAALEDQLITQNQYDQMLGRFVEKRDKAVAAAESTASAEAKLERQLRSVLGAYDPVIKAQNQYEQNAATLKSALDAGLISEQKYTAALKDQQTALESVKASQSSFSTMGDDYEKALRQVLPYRAELHNLEQQQKTLDQARKSGLIITEQQKKDYDQATAAIARQTQEYHRRIEAANKNVISAKQEAAAMRGLPAQFTDIIVSLQGGQAPLTVLLQQGGQIKDMFGGIGPAIRAMTVGLIEMINPLTLSVAILGTLAAAAYAGASEMQEFNKALIQTRGASGLTASDFTQLRDQLDGTVGTAGKAAEVLTAMTASGKIASDVFAEVGEAAITMERATGQSMDSILEDFSALGKDPVDAAVRLDEKYRFLTTAVLSQADALVRQGKEQEAVTLLQGEMARAATDTANKMIEEAGYIDKAWVAVKDTIKETWDALRGLGREQSVRDQLNDVQGRMQYIRDSVSGNENALKRDSRYQELLAEERMLKIRIDQEQQLADHQAEQERIRKKGTSSLAALGSAYISNVAAIDKVKAANDALKISEKKVADVRAAAAQQGRAVNAEEQLLIDAELSAAKQRIKDAEEAQARKDKTPTVPVNTNDVVEAKSNISAVVSEYDNYFKKISTLRDSNVISESAAYYAQKAILEAQAKSVTSAYDQQIEAIKKLQGNKKNSASANISLDNQLSKAEAARLKAMEDNQAKQEQLDIKFTASIEKRNASIKSYNDALREQVRALEASGARAVSGVGRGDRQAGVAQALDDNDRNYARERRRLAEREKEMDPIEYAENLKNLERAHTDMSDQILKNDKAIMDANADWTNGFTKAVENAQDAGLDFASSVNSALSGAFQSAGDALYEFVTTGKLSFSDFASSVIKDMARIASQQAANGLLSALLGVGMAAAGNYGGLTTTGVTGAGSFGQLGGSYTGTGIFGATQAQGGAWSGGTQMFANGGAFTNQIVSTPTAFGMANGAKGIMGEAGDEAIVPLARTRNGDLGVRMAGGAGGGGSVVNVTVIVNNDGSTTSTSDSGSAWQGLGDKIGPIVRKEVYSVLNTEMRPGGTIEPQKGR